MILQVAVCSKCNTRKDITEVGPRGWYQVKSRNISNGEFFQNLDFCSEKCLLEFAQQEVKQQKEVVRRGQINMKAYKKIYGENKKK